MITQFLTVNLQWYYSLLITGLFNLCTDKFNSFAPGDFAKKTCFEAS